MRLRRGILLSLIAGMIVVFLLVSIVIARALGVSGSERSALTTLARAEARGDAAAVTRGLDGCSPAAACAARGAALAARLKRPGTVTVLAFTASTGFTLSGGSGVARIAWHAGDGPPVVQCARTVRSGDIVSGLRVRVSAFTDPIKSDGSCPRRVG